MKIHILKYGNLMGSPDLKKLMHDAGNAKASDDVWDAAYPVKLAFGLDGRSTSVLLTGDSPEGLLPALVDCSYLCADQASHGEASVRAALNAVCAAGVDPAEIRSHLITHAHADHLDPRLTQHFTKAKAYSHPASKIPGTAPLPDSLSRPDLLALDTPGHGCPHSSYIVDVPEQDLSVLLAGDLIMSHAHYLSLDHPSSFSDHAAGRASVSAALDALRARTSKLKMIIPGHDIPFFV